MAEPDTEAVRKWARIVEQEARDFGVPYADAYRANIQTELREKWESASIFGKIGLWMIGDMPENANWRQSDG